MSGQSFFEAVSATLASKDDPSVRFVADIPGNLGPVLLNRRQIQLVVSNLARNAIEAPRRGKELTLVLRVRPLGHEWVEVSLADNAAGIPESVQERLFSRFETSKSKGSGIGLPLCRDIVEAHGGEIWFEVRAGQGHHVLLHAAKSALRPGRPVNRVSVRAHVTIAREAKGVEGPVTHMRQLTRKRASHLYCCNNHKNLSDTGGNRWRASRRASATWRAGSSS